RCRRAPPPASLTRPTFSACPARPAPARTPGTRSWCTNSTTGTDLAISSKSCRASTSTCAGRRRKARPPDASKCQIPVLRDDLLAEGLLRLALGQRKAAAGIDPARGDELGMRPQRDALVTGLTCERDALVDELRAETEAAAFWIDQHESDAGDLV